MKFLFEKKARVVRILLIASPKLLFACSCLCDKMLEHLAEEKIILEIVVKPISAKLCVLQRCCLVGKKKKEDCHDISR